MHRSVPRRSRSWPPPSPAVCFHSHCCAVVCAHVTHPPLFVCARLAAEHKTLQKAVADMGKDKLRWLPRAQLLAVIPQLAKTIDDDGTHARA